MADDPAERGKAADKRKADAFARLMATALAKERPGDPQPAVSAEDLLEAVNASSGQARVMWLGFLGLVAYLFVAIAGVTHKDLLLNSPIRLPIVGVEIPLFSFFIFAPVLLLLVHLGLLMQHAMLSQKIGQFLKTLKDGVPWGPGPHPRRSRLHAYTQTQLLAGPERSKIVGMFLHVMSWFTIYALPVLLFLSFQLKFLPYHDLRVTLGHAGVLTLDLLIVILIGIFIARPSAKLRASFWQVITTKKALSVLVTTVTAVVLYGSFFVITVPDRGMDYVRKHPPGGLAWAFAPAALFNWLIFTDDVDYVTGTPTPGWQFSRNLVVTDKELVPGTNKETEEVSISLRGRDLRYAVLDRSDLHRTDLTGVDLSDASLESTRLENAALSCARASEQVSLPQCPKLRRANLYMASLHGADLKGADLREASLQLADLHGADLRGAELQGANLRGAGLQGANLVAAKLQGADLVAAKLQGADLREANLQVADLERAGLLGAILRRAQLQGAYLFEAQLQGADLTWAHLQGAFLVDAKLHGAFLAEAGLQDANLLGVGLRGANLRGAAIWQTDPPKIDDVDLADLSDIRIATSSEEDLKRLLALVEGSRDKPWGRRLEAQLAPLLHSGTSEAWASSEGYQAWAKLKSLPKPSPGELSKFLTKLACGTVPGGYVAKGIAWRAFAPFPAHLNYEGDLNLLAQGLTKKSCWGAADLDDETIIKLCVVAAWPEDQIGETICAQQ